MGDAAPHLPLAPRHARRGESASLRRSLAVFLLLAVGAFGWAAWYDRSAPAPGAWLPAAGLEPRFETISGRRLRFVRAGSGPAIVLVHGFGSSIYTWKDVIAPLAAGHDVVALDLPGFGESDRPADLTIDDLPRAVTGLMERLGLERAALVGNSMGGATAVLVAATSPDRVDALVLIDAAGFNLEPEAQPASVRLATSWAAPALELLPGKRLVVERSLRQVFHDQRLVTEERVAEYLGPARRPGTFTGLRSLGASLDARPDAVTRVLPEVRAPTLVIWGDDDRWIPPSDAQRFAAAIPGARAVLVASCGHVPQEEKPAEVARLVLELLAEASAPPATGSRAARRGCATRR